MSWAKYAIEALQRGETAMIRPRGHSMKGKVNDGDLVTLAPCDPASLSVGDIVLVRVHGNDYLHLIKAIDGERFQIGNNRGGINGWVRAGGIYGIATKVEPYSPERRKQGGQLEETS
jgi:hypothetical protein